jgi:hypothetical protein
VCIAWTGGADGRPCDDGDPCSEGDACAGGKCLGDVPSPACALPPTCPDGIPVAAFAFHGGLPGGAEVEDDDPLDAVTVSWVEEPASSAPGSAYFGDPVCLSYEDELGPDCAPPLPGTATEGVDLALRLPAVAVPAAGPVGPPALRFRLRMAAEPSVDQLRVLAEPEGGDPVLLWESTHVSALGPGNTTGGAFLPFEVDLAPFSGQSIAIVFRFASDGDQDLAPEGAEEPWEGAFVDDVQVLTPCDACVIAADCGADACLAAACLDGACEVQGLEPACCHPGTAFPKETAPSTLATEGFELGVVPAGWKVEDPLPGDSVTWTVDSQQSFQGKMSLFFGDKASQTYVSSLAAPAKGTVLTPVFSLAEDDLRTPTLAFALRLSTEWDVAPEPPDEGNEVDLLRVQVLPEGGVPATLWDSNAIGGTTGGAWVPIALDLTPWKGETVRIAFAFDSFDAAENAFGGPRIDELSVDWRCETSPCATASDCDDGDVCTADLCLLGQCDHPRDPACCLVDSDCDDGNGCTKDLCDENACIALADPALSDSCCSEAPWPGAVVFDFESGDQGFTVLSPSAPVKWHRKLGAAASGKYAFTFSDPKMGTYEADTAVSGQLVSPPVEVPPYGLGVPYAAFTLLLSTEWDEIAFSDFSPSFLLDELRVRVALATPSGPDPAPSKAPIHWKSHYLGNSTHGLWLGTKVDLSDYRGETVHLVFEFVSGDSFENDWPGPFVDDVSFGTTCLPDSAIACVYGGDCPPLAGTCEAVTCDDLFQCVPAPFTKGCAE